MTRHRSSYRMLILTGVAIASGCVLLTTAVLRLDGATKINRRITDETIPASVALDESIAEATNAQRFFEEAATTNDVNAVGALLGDAQEAGRLSTAAWDRYAASHDPTPAERRLRQERLRLSRASEEAGARVFAIDRVADPAAFEAALTEEKALANSGIALKGEIEDRFVLRTLREDLPAVSRDIDSTRRNTLIAFGIVNTIGIALAFWFFRTARTGEKRQERADRALAHDAQLSDIETQLQRGLEMQPNEAMVYDVVGEALQTIARSLPSEFLVADSSRAHFRKVTSNEVETPPGCPVGAPDDCPATTSGQTRIFPDSRRLDTCRYLRDRGDDPLWAACVPVSIAGRAVGVLHAATPVDAASASDAVHGLELIARKAGDRIGVIRVLAKSETQAQIDVLTGLPNRRTMENAAHRLISDDTQFCVAFVDLDHFKNLNDSHGHEMGDRALRLFARVLRDSVRPNDVPARFGGEEFVTLLPSCSIEDAATVAQRLRASLVAALGGASVPAFTVSVGIASREPGETFSEVLVRADEALLYAKGHGRDRVVTTGDLPGPGTTTSPNGADAPASDTVRTTAAT